MAVRVVIERGPKGKKAVAFALDWPGWERGAKTADDALASFEAYRERYRPIAIAAGLGDEFDAAGPPEVVEERIGPGSTDFWGISFAPCSFEADPIDPAELERRITILRACWAYFDAVAARVSPEMRKGVRGGGRDWDRIVSHVIRVESEDFARRVGLLIPEGGAVPPDARAAYREAYVKAVRSYARGEAARRMQNWTLPFLLRHSAYHTMDHAWEMEDRDLSGGELVG